eukprot:scaffold2040_cov132-Skeletonema_menzelii.AAC.3
MSLNPSMASQTMEANGAVMTPLRLACMYTNASNLSAGLEMIELLFDAYPEAVIGDSEVAVMSRLTENRFVDEVFNFLSAQRSYVEIAGNIQLVTTPDENGYLPLHIALHDQARLCAINLLVQADPSPSNDGNIVLHEACRLRKYDVIELILAPPYPTAQVCARNLLGELPLQVLLANGDDEQESVRYLSSIFLLLKANPPIEISMNDTNLVSDLASLSMHEHSPAPSTSF